MAGARQESSEQSTKNGIAALESAQGGVKRSKQDVDGIRSDLHSGYQGSDGGEFGDLLVQWDEQVGVVIRNLQEMIDSLHSSLTTHNKTLTTSKDAIRSASAQSDAVFSDLTPTG